jgi:spermidine/putrescine transport system permease protein
MMLQNKRAFILILPGFLWLVGLMVVPCAVIFAMAFFERGVYGGIDYSAATFANFRRATDPLYLSILLDSARIALTATALALLLAYPAAYAITRAKPVLQPALLVMVMLPFWSNYLIRTYAWMVLLNREGVINSFLRSLGAIDEPLAILYNEFSVVLGLIYNYCPFVILAIYAALQRLDPSYAEASRDLGAGPWATFFRITLPLTLPGVAAGGVFVFVLSIGNFITPDLLGGGRMQMVGNLIYDQFLTARDWPFGATLSMILLAVMMMVLFLQALAANQAHTRSMPRYA